jgi:hypothetical protein
LKAPEERADTVETKIDEYLALHLCRIEEAVDQDGSYARVLTVSTRFDS